MLKLEDFVVKCWSHSTSTLEPQSRSSQSQIEYNGPTSLGHIPQLVSELKVESQGHRVRSLWEEREEELFEAKER